MANADIEIIPGLTIPEGEVTFTFSRSGGPGGQNVNKVSTQVTAHFDVLNSESLDESQRKLILSALETRINREGVLLVVSRKHRTQNANREEATQRLAALLRTALTPKKKRRPTRIPKASRVRRLEEKTRRSRIKKDRGPVKAVE